MTAQDTTTIFHRVINEVVNTGDLDRADAFVAPDFVDHNVATGEPIIGLDSFKQGTAALRAAFPDIQITIEDAVAAENKIAYRIAMSGTQLGPFAGFPPCGKYCDLVGDRDRAYRRGQDHRTLAAPRHSRAAATDRRRPRPPTPDQELADQSTFTPS